jgi:hypothetical protein
MEALGTGDGVSNVALGTARLLRELGEPGTIHARFVAPEFADQTQSRHELLARPDGALLFHYWNYNTSTWTVHAVHGRRAIYFHGITPPEFFAPGSDLHRQTSDGYAQIRRLVNSFDLIVGLSRDALATVCRFLSRPRPALHMYPVIDPEECRNFPVDGGSWHSSSRAATSTSSSWGASSGTSARISSCNCSSATTPAIRARASSSSETTRASRGSGPSSSSSASRSGRPTA